MCYGLLQVEVIRQRMTRQTLAALVVMLYSCQGCKQGSWRTHSRQKHREWLREKGLSQTQMLTKGWPVKGNDSAASRICKRLHDVAPSKGTSAKAMHQHDSSLIWGSSLYSTANALHHVVLHCYTPAMQLKHNTQPDAALGCMAPGVNYTCYAVKHRCKATKQHYKWTGRPCTPKDAYSCGDCVD